MVEHLFLAIDPVEVGIGLGEFAAAGGKPTPAAPAQIPACGFASGQVSTFSYPGRMQVFPTELVQGNPISRRERGWGLPAQPGWGTLPAATRQAVFLALFPTAAR